MTEEELSRKVDEIAAKMTTEEKIAFCSGKDFWHTREMAGCEVPEMMMTDGPNGLRKQNGKPDALGAEGSEEATCFPTAVTAAQTWSADPKCFSSSQFSAAYSWKRPWG